MPNESSRFQEDPNAEVAATLAELVASFGEAVVASAAHSLLAKHSASPEKQQATLRNFTLLIMEAKHPRAIAQIVARLCYLDTATGHELRQEDIARAIGITKQAVCNMEADIAARLNLPRRSSPQAREAHRRMNKRNYSHASNPR